MAFYEIDWDKFLRLSDSEQRTIAQDLAGLEEAAEANPLLFFEPHPKQIKFLESRQRFKLFLGGNRSGKTTIATIDDIIQACDEEALPAHLRKFKKWQPPFIWRVVAPDFDHVHNVIIPTFQEWCPKRQLLGDSFDTAYEKRYNIISFKNGSKMYVKTYEQDPFRHGGAKLHRVRFDEEPPRAIYSENTYRLIDWGGDCLIAMTPVLGLSWTYDTFWIPWTRGRLQDAFIELVDMDDNPHLDAAGKAAALQGSSAEEREARKTGKFVHFHGLVYPGIDDNIVPQGDGVPPGATVYVGIDPGIRHMAAVVFVYHTADDVLVVFDELGLQGMSVKDVAEQIQLKCVEHEIRPAWYVIDPSARNKQHVTGRSLQQEYADQGIVTFAGQNDVRAGLNNVKVRLENQALLISQNCEITIEQFRKYRWVRPKKALEGDAREAPIKKDDHLLDALRYLCMARPYSPESSELPEFVSPLLQAAVDDMEKRPPSLPAFAY